MEDKAVQTNLIIIHIIITTIYSKRQKYLYFGRLLAPTACRKAANYLIRSRVHPPEGYSKRHFLMSLTINLKNKFLKDIDIMWEMWYYYLMYR